MTIAILFNNDDIWRNTQLLNADCLPTIASDVILSMMIKTTDVKI